MVYSGRHWCGCHYLLPASKTWSYPEKKYLAQVSTKAHTTILGSTSRTTLTQTFVNPSDEKGIKEVIYTFPLYDGVSVVAFTCRVGDRVITGEVKEKDKARAAYKEAKERGEVAGLLEQSPDASDAFTTKIGNIPPGADIIVDITFLGELKHDAEVDGIRFTIPTIIAPRYGEYIPEISRPWKSGARAKGFEVTVDAELPEGSFIREIRSPSHPIAVSLGTTSLSKNADPVSNKASASLSLATAELGKDFVLQVVAKETAAPKALLETHPTIPNHRALMATLVPKFALPPERPEIVFVCDRSGSMSGSKINALRNALKVFLKSLPVGTKFNICSFGSSYSFLWEQSKSYSESSLNQAMKHVGHFDANFGGTEMFAPLEETIKRRYTDMNLEIFLVTDGEIWDQERLFGMLNEEIGVKKAPIRVFTLGIGDAFSSSLIEGVARAGNGFSQAVGNNEKLDGKVVRMLKAALSPHINDYHLALKYPADNEDGFELANVATSATITIGGDQQASKPKPSILAKISLFDTSVNPDADEPATEDNDGDAKYKHLPVFKSPELLQTPHRIPSLFPFSRTTVYILMSASADPRNPSSVLLRGTSNHGPLELEIPIQVLPVPGQTLHQLAAKKAVHELEEGRGWLSDAKIAGPNNTLLKNKYEGRFSDMVEREAVRLGVEFQVGGKWCSFVAVEKKIQDKDGDSDMKEAEDWDFLDSEVHKMTLVGDEHMALESSRARKSSKVLFGVQSPPPAPAARQPFGAIMRRRAEQGSHSGAPPMATMALGSGLPGGAPSRTSRSSFGSGGRGGFGGANTIQHFAAPPALESTPRPKFEALEDKSLSATVSTQLVNPYSAEDDSGDEEEDDGTVLASHSTKSLFGSTKFEKKKKKVSAGSSINARPQPGNTQSPLQTLIDLQTFEGYWELTSDLVKAIGVDMAKAKRRGGNVEDTVLATALAVQFLVLKLLKEKDSWELVVDKARSWLELKGFGEESEIWTTAQGLIV